jgi:hypothetical protein
MSSLAIGVTMTVEVQLEVGNQVETVTVTAESPVVDFTSAQVKGNVGAGELKDLPSTTAISSASCRWCRVSNSTPQQQRVEQRQHQRADVEPGDLSGRRRSNN